MGGGRLMARKRPVVVTDSTASLPPEMAAERGIVVVPLEVVIGAETHFEGDAGATPAMIAEALRAFTPVSTSRPSPARLLEAWVAAAQRTGADEILAVHLSGEMSGTVDSARRAAREAAEGGLAVRTVDTRQVGVATGYAALSAAEAIEAGAALEEAARAAERRAAAATSMFYVDTLEYLRRGGRIGAAAALLGSALAVKPLLRIDEGVVGSMERVRTAGRALGRMADLAVEAAGTRPVDVGVFHLANAERADGLATSLTERLADQLEGRGVLCGELGAVLGAHVGPGMVAVCVAPR